MHIFAMCVDIGGSVLTIVLYAYICRIIGIMFFGCLPSTHYIMMYFSSNIECLNQ